MTVNPLVAAKTDSTTWHTGLGVIDDAASVYDGISSGSWIETGLGVVGGALDLLNAVMNPVATLVQYGLSWLIEHVKPLHDALDKLAGDGDQIAAYAQTWSNVSQAVGQVGQDLVAAVRSEAASWTGPAADAYREHIQRTATGLQTMSTCAGGIGVGVKLVGVLVAAVRAMVRDMVTYAIGEIVQDALEEVFSFGLATPVVIAQVVSTVSEWVSKIGQTISRLIKSVAKLRPLMGKLEEIFGSLSKLFKGEHSAPHPEPADVPHTPHDPGGAPDPHAPGTSPSAAAPPDTPAGAHPGADGPSTAPASADPPGGHTDPADGPATTPSGTTTDPAGAPGEHPGTTADPAAAPGDHPGAGPGHAGSDDPGIGAANRDPARNSAPNEQIPTAGDPIDLSTGRMLQAETDLELPGVLALVLTRTHRSDYRLGRSFGPSWASTMDQRVEVRGDQVHYAAADGMLLTYPVPAPHRRALPRQGPAWPLSVATDGTVTIEDRAARQFLHFPPDPDGVGRLAAITDRNDNRITIDRDPRGVPIGVRHSGGYRVELDNVDGLVTELRLADPAGGPPVVVRRYRYDTAARLTEVVNSSGLAMRFGYDADGRMRHWEDRNGMWYRFAYDAAGRCVRGEGRDGHLSYTFDYDETNRITRATDSLGNTTTYHLNAGRQVVRLVDPLGHTTESEWDEHHQLRARTDPLGRVTRFGYDDEGQLTSVTRPDAA
jgi:YD repeat-containing protein